MNIQVIRTLVVKELMIYFRNKFLAVITVLALVGYLAIYFLLPSDVDVNIELGLYLDGDVSAETLALFESEEETSKFVVPVYFETEEELTTAVEEGDYPGGIVISAADESQVTLYLSAKSEDAANEWIKVSVGAIFNGSQISLDNITILPEGHDLEGEALAMRERMIPMFAVIILLMEIMGLSGLIAEERTTKTLQALLVTPMTVTDFFIGKAIMGIGLAFTQAFIMMLVIGGFKSEPLSILAILFVGAMMITGISFLIGSFGKDMMGIMGWTVLILFTFMIPALTVMFPGTAAQWIKIIPSYYIVDTVHQIVNFGATGADVIGNIVITLLFAIAFLVLGVEVLKRRLV